MRNMGVTLCVATFFFTSGLFSGKVQRFQMEARRSWKSMQCIRSQPARSALVSRALQLDALASFTSELEQVIRKDCELQTGCTDSFSMHVELQKVMYGVGQMDRYSILGLPERVNEKSHRGPSFINLLPVGSPRAKTL